MYIFRLSTCFKPILLLLFIALAFNSSAQTINTYAGKDTVGFSGDGGQATAAKLHNPCGLATDAAGNVYFADGYNHRIRKITTSGIITTIAGNGTPGFGGDGSAATAAQLDYPRAVAIDGSGNIFISDNGNFRIRKVTPTGTISTIAGTSVAGFSGDGGPATIAQLNDPGTIAVDLSGNVIIADQLNNRIRMVTPSGTISTIAGTGVAGYMGDGSAATAAQLNQPSGVAVDGSGNVYIADFMNHVIRKINTSGIITTVAGTGTAGYFGDCAAATAAQLANPSAVAADGAGNIYITDEINHAIRKVNTGGIISTYAGNGTSGYSGDGGPATDAQLKFPYGVAVNAGGDVFIGDQLNNRVRVVTGGGGGIPPVTGPDSVCSGAAITLADATTGGTWSSANTAIATVGSLTGIVTGITGGTTSIIYTLGSGCTMLTAFLSVRVIPSTAGNIIGDTALCIGHTTALTDSVSGGTWINYNTAIATVSITGLATGVSPGTDTIGYVIHTSCGTDTARHILKVLPPDSCATTGTSITRPPATPIIVYPNPASDQITIENLLNGRVDILNITGSVLISREVTGNTTTIAIHDLPTGVYILKAISNGNTTAYKFIKQ